VATKVRCHMRRFPAPQALTCKHSAPNGFMVHHERCGAHNKPSWTEASPVDGSALVGHHMHICNPLLPGFPPVVTLDPWQIWLSYCHPRGCADAPSAYTAPWPSYVTNLGARLLGVVALAVAAAL